ncbi:Permease of the drug/metabolite transporter (DMT) superfamily [Lachnospiraceae bacterium]|nr:Permease of the drug/metabolite transporter (DMT) superfamily [Lachnospiraceae bacterium]
MITENNKNTFWTRIPVILSAAFFATFLWGSAFPCIKVGYSLMNISSNDSASQMLFAGIRFFLAGAMVLLFGSIQQHKPLLLGKGSIKNVLILMLTQTVGQYFFFYIGLAHASGVASSIIEASATFFTILAAVFIFHFEKLTPMKVLGCVLGFAGVLIVQIPGQQMGTLSLTGEGFVLISTLMASAAANFIKIFSKNESAVALSGWQFTGGGLIMAVFGLLSGGKLTFSNPAALLLIVYMAFISAAAYTLWGLLLSHNDVSRIAVFGFFNPLVGVLLSAVLLNEQNEAFSVYGMLALILVCLGIIIVFRKTKTN